MLEFDDRQREVLIDKLPDAANLALGGLVFGQFATGRPFSLAAAAAGALGWTALLAWSLFLARRR